MISHLPQPRRVRGRGPANRNSSGFNGSWYLKCPHSLMDRTLACGACNVGSIPTEGIKSKVDVIRHLLLHFYDSTVGIESRKSACCARRSSEARPNTLSDPELVEGELSDGWSIPLGAQNHNPAHARMFRVVCYRANPAERVISNSCSN